MLKEQAEKAKGLRVWNSKKDSNMFWSPECGDMLEPAGWDFLPAGDAFLTRVAKKLGPHWVLLRRHKERTYTVGIICPANSIKEARKLEEETKEKRESDREKSKIRRERMEENYKEELEGLMYSYLNFSKRYSKLAHKICSEALKRATVIGSGRVGRTRLISAQERAILAVRAHIRHNYTSYEEQMAERGMFDVDKDEHATLKARASEEVDEFIRKHRDQKLDID